MGRVVSEETDLSKIVTTSFVVDYNVVILGGEFGPTCLFHMGVTGTHTDLFPFGYFDGICICSNTRDTSA